MKAWHCNSELLTKAINAYNRRKFNEIPYEVIAVMELNCTGVVNGKEIDIVDIEFTIRDYIEEDNTLVYDYYSCVHYNGNDFDGWESFEFVDFGEDDPMKFTSEEELKDDMLTQIKLFCEYNDIKLV